MIYTTKALKGDLDGFTIDQVGHEIKAGYVVALTKDGALFIQLDTDYKDKEFLVCKVFKNGKVMVRELIAEHLPERDFFTLSCAFVCRPEMIYFSRERA